MEKLGAEVKIALASLDTEKEKNFAVANGFKIMNTLLKKSKNKVDMAKSKLRGTQWNWLHPVG